MVFLMVFMALGLESMDAGNSKETGFRIDGIQAAVFSELHPCNIVIDGFTFQPGMVESA